MIFKDYFEKYKKIVNKDMDKIRFCGRVHWIITLDLDKPLLLTDPDNQEYIILVKNINIDGEKTILPILILCGIFIQKK